MMKKITIAPLLIFMFMSLSMTACAKQQVTVLAPQQHKIIVSKGVTKAPPWVQNVTTAKKTSSSISTWAHPAPEDIWKEAGEDKIWAKIRRTDGKLAWASFQNAPARDPKKAEKKIEKGIPVCSAQQDVNFSVAWRTDKTSHPGEKDGQWGHVGIRCYDNIGKQCPPTKGEAWQNIIKLINEPTPPIPANWKPDMVFGDWLGSCN